MYDTDDKDIDVLNLDIVISPPTLCLKLTLYWLTQLMHKKQINLFSSKNF